MLAYLDVMKRLSRGNLLISSTQLSFPPFILFYKIFFHLVWVIATNPPPVTLLAYLFILDSNFHTASSCHLNSIQVCMFVIKPFQKYITIMIVHAETIKSHLLSSHMHTYLIW